MKEGFLETKNGKIFFKKVGTGARTPLICLHGGPGSPHDSLLRLAALGDERKVIFYDQIGCGKSDRPDNPSLWTTETFVQELNEIAAALNLTKFHLFGVSWGSMLAVDFYLEHPKAVRSLILAGPCLSVSLWQRDATKLKKGMGEEWVKKVDELESAGNTNNPEYQALQEEFLHKHICRVHPWPQEILEARKGKNPKVYQTMWGPSESHPTGTLKGYERRKNLGKIAVPTLFTCGRFDEATPEATAEYASLVPNATLSIFEQSSHTPHLEETESYLAILRSFLAKVEGGENP